MKRLFVEEPLLIENYKPVLKKKQIHYLLHVLRVKLGEELLLFNGRNGEWRAKIIKVEKRNLDLLVMHKEREQTKRSNLVYCFAPLKKARLDYMVQKAVEMGVGILQPVITEHAQSSFLKMERIHTNSIEAAEQCGILSLPSSLLPISLNELLETWHPNRYLIFCDETKKSKSPLPILRNLRKAAAFGLIIGPEGGFSKRERSLLQKQDFVISISLGTRILRADTAAVAALSLLNATILEE